MFTDTSSWQRMLPVLMCFAACTPAREATPQTSVSPATSASPQATEDPRETEAREVDSLLSALPAHKPKLALVFVLDGLRPDSITPEQTPNLHALRADGVAFSASHSVFPTVTRVNASSFATGRYPRAHGIIGNSIYAPAVDPSKAISTGEYDQLRALEKHGPLLLTESLGEILARQGKKLAVVSSSGNGCAYLLNHKAAAGVGVLINGYLDPGKLVAFPGDVHDKVVARFGHPPPRDQAAGAVDWAENVLREYVLPELAPDVIINWITQPDSAQHKFGARSPEAKAAISNADRNIGLVLDKLKALALYDKTSIFVVSDHGFSLIDYVVNLASELVKAGLKESLTSQDVVVAGNAIHVPSHDPERIRAIAEFLQKQSYIDAVFSAARSSGKEEPLGVVEGTFSLAFARLDPRERAADLVVSFPWSSELNRYGARGRQALDGYRVDDVTGPRDGDESGHGNLSPFDVRNTWFAWGAGIKHGLTSPVPVSNVDLLPTLLTLLNVPVPEVDGRVLAEAFEGGPEAEKIPIATRAFAADAKSTPHAILQVSYVGRHRYLDKTWRSALSPR